MNPRRIVTLTVGLVAMGPGPAVAQTQSPWSIVNVTTQVCPAFMRSGDIRQAQADAESHGYRVLKVEPDNAALYRDPDAPPRAVWMTGGTLGALHLSRLNGRAMCAVGIEEATVALISELADQKLQDLGYRTELSDDEGGVASWVSGDARALVMRSAHHLPGVEMTYVARRRSY